MGALIRVAQGAVNSIWNLRRKQATARYPVASTFGSWFPTVHEPFTGAWQRGIEVRRDSVLAYSAVYACVTLIASDIAKMRLKLVRRSDRIWSETSDERFSPLLRKPNRYQTRSQFFKNWATSKLINGNAYVLKSRGDGRRVVGLYVLDPSRVKPLVADDGSVFYELHRDNLSELETDVVTVPASEIIHDVMVPLFHPLVGVSPIFACGLAATQGLSIQNQSTRFFENMSRPSGFLVAPGRITDETALRLKTEWEKNYTGENTGRTAVLGDGLKYEQLTMNAVDADLMAQLKWTAENVCSCFHVPAHMVGIGAAPTYNNIEALNQQYYSQCLQGLIEDIEGLLDYGLEMPESLGTQFDLGALLRMDTATRYKAHSDAVGGGWMAPNEARAKEDMPPVVGGESPYLQQQNYSLEALSERDSNKPFSKPQPAPTPPPEQPANDNVEAERALYAIQKGLR